MSLDWEDLKLGNVLDVKYGKDHKNLINGSIPVYGSGGIMRYVNVSICNHESILIPRKGTLNNIFYKNEPFWTVDTMFWSIIDRTKAFPKFLYYKLKTIDFNLMNVGSAVPSLTVPIIQDIDITLPSLPEQESIAEVLSSLDDKIDLLQQLNKTLEALAETLFRQWFLDETIENHSSSFLLCQEIQSVSETHKFKKGEAVFLNTSDIYLGDILTDVYTDKSKLPGQAKKSIKKGDILFSEIRPSNGRWAYVDFDSTDYVVSTKLMVLRSNGKIKPPFLYFFLTQKSTIDYLQMMAESRSGTFPQITFEQLKPLKIYVPSNKKLKYAEDFCEDSLAKILFNKRQIKQLETLRDTLLPKLMNGTLRVN